jgi:hypothetical protein
MIWETHGTFLAALITGALVLVLVAIVAGVIWLRRRPDVSEPPRLAASGRTSGMLGHARITHLPRPVQIDAPPAPDPPSPGRAGHRRSGAGAVVPEEIHGAVQIHASTATPAPTRHVPRPSPSSSNDAPAPSDGDAQIPTFVSPVDPKAAVPPRFGAGSEAARLPWFLPEEPAAPSGVAADQATLGALTVRAASVVGPGHRCARPAGPRQDAYRIAQDGAAAHLIVAVADGMSDSVRAEFGAMVAVGKAVGLVRNRLDRGEQVVDLRARTLFTDVAAGIVAAAEERGLSAEDVRTTLTVAVIPAGPAATPRTAWVGHVADTTVWLRDARSWRQVTANVKDSFDGGALRTFMPHHHDAAINHTFTVTAGATVAILSDGVADSFNEIPGAAEWFAERWREPPPLGSFVLDVDFDAKTQHDDRTAVVVWCDHDPHGGDRGADA